MSELDSVLPVFHSCAELQADTQGWDSYLRGVYGQHLPQCNDSHAWPLSTKRFNFFYRNSTLMPAKLKPFMASAKPFVNAIGAAPRLGQLYHFGIWESHFFVRNLQTAWLYLFSTTPQCGRATPHCKPSGLFAPPGDHYPYASGFPSGTTIEVMHAGRDAGPASGSGYWMFRLCPKKSVITEALCI